MDEAEQETEVSAKATRRRYTSEYKRKILGEAAACKERGELGALLRREGLYSSHLAAWRVALEKSELIALAPKKRGPVPKRVDPIAQKLAESEREVARLQKRLARAEVIIGFQKKVSEVLGIVLPDPDEKL